MVENLTVDVNGEKLVHFDGPEQRKLEATKKAQKPDVSVILNEMLPAFREILAQKSCSW